MQTKGDKRYLFIISNFADEADIQIFIYLFTSSKYVEKKVYSTDIYLWFSKNVVQSRYLFVNSRI